MIAVSAPRIETLQGDISTISRGFTVFLAKSALPSKWARQQDSANATVPCYEDCGDVFGKYMTLLILVLGLTVGVRVGLLGIGGGVVLVPAMVYLLHFDQHMAQGTSLLILLPPIGLGALREYWKNGQVDLRAGVYCALGFLLGGYGGGKMAVPMPSSVLKAIFGCFLMVSG